MSKQLLAAAALALGLTTQADAAELASASRLAFGPQDVLFVADWAGGSVHALTLPEAPAADGKPFNVTDLDSRIRPVLGGADYVLEDMAARPGSGEVYLTVSVGPQHSPAILAATADGTVRRLDLAQMHDTSAKLEHTPAAALKFWDAIPGRSFTVTDMKWHDGKLYLAGLSNQSFASTLRIIPYPFGTGAAMASVEMYHTTHNQVETRAPIRAMAFTELDGKPTLLAAYLCTPLVTIPLDALNDGAHVRGKTIAELGDAGTPADLVPYRSMDMASGKMTDYVLVANLWRGTNVVPLASIAEANRGAGYSTPVPFGQVAGVAHVEGTMNTVMRVDNQDDKYFVALRRDLPTGHAQLMSYDKMAGFRLSDYDVSEYLFPDYAYDASDPARAQFVNAIHGMQNMLKTEEGFSDQVRP